MYFCETGGFAAVYSYGMIDRQLFMRRRRINILLRRGATLTEGIDRMKTYKTIMNGLTKVEEFVLCVITVVVTAITFINSVCFPLQLRVVRGAGHQRVHPDDHAGLRPSYQRRQHDYAVPDLRQCGRRG